MFPIKQCYRSVKRYVPRYYHSLPYHPRIPRVMEHLPEDSNGINFVVCPKVLLIMTISTQEIHLYPDPVVVLTTQRHSNTTYGQPQQKN